MAVSADNNKLTVFEFDPELARELAASRADPRRRGLVPATHPQNEFADNTHGKRPMNLNMIFWTLNVVIACLVLTNLYIANLRDRGLAREVAETGRQTELLRLESETQRERAAVAEQKLKEQGSADGLGWRLNRLEKLVLPRSLTAEQLYAIQHDLGEFGSINIGLKQAGGEPEAYAMALISALQGGGIMGESYVLRGDHYQGVDMLYANDLGKQLADKLHQLGIVDYAGPVSQAGPGYENLPRNQNTLVVGDSVAAFSQPHALDAPSAKEPVVSKLQH